MSDMDVRFIGWDLLKLLGKETIVPKGGSALTFLMAPLFGMAAVTLVSTLIIKAIIDPSTGFIGDYIVALYFLMVPAIAVIIGGFASKNPIASLGASREMKLMMAYELPFILIALVPVIQSKGDIQLGQLITYQSNHGLVFTSVSGVIAIVVAIMVMQAKLTLVPFDIPEAETEIMSGPFVEYSGPPLAVFKLTRMMMLFTMPMFLVVLFLGGMGSFGFNHTDQKYKSQGAH
jgi:NADH-quinone oxidoreductase subunit H